MIILALILGVGICLTILKVLGFSIKIIYKALKNAIAGAILLFLANLILEPLFSITLPITNVSAFLVGLSGIFGLVALLIYTVLKK